MPVGRIVVIAGTDAGIGKTHVTARLAKYCRSRGVAVRAVKLIETGTLVDVARVLKAPVIVVAADRLGTINHTLLTVSALELAGVACLGVVMNRIPGDVRDATQGNNLEALKQVSPALRVVATAADGWESAVLGR